MRRAIVLICLLLLVAVLSCSQSATDIPTFVPTAAVSNGGSNSVSNLVPATFTPEKGIATNSKYTPQATYTVLPTYTPYPTFTPPTSSVEPTIQQESDGTSQHNTIDGLIGSMLEGHLKSGTLYTEIYDQDLDGNYYQGGRVGYDIDFVLNSPSDWTGEELLTLAYTFFHEFYINFSDDQPMFLTLHIRAYQNDVIGGCVLGIGVGYQAVSTYLPTQRPSSLEAWFGSLRNARYYGDLPGQTDAFLAYGNDPGDATNCDLVNWKR